MNLQLSENERLHACFSQKKASEAPRALASLAAREPSLATSLVQQLEPRFRPNTSPRYE
jgi:hypothetical protein